MDSRKYYSVFISRKSAPKNVFKIFPEDWVSKLSKRQLLIIIDELLFWDGNNVPNRNQIEYSSKEYKNVLFIQTISHLVGYSSSICSRKNKFGKWYKASILFDKNHFNTQGIKKDIIKYNGFVYCVTVDSGRIIVRQNGKISITGNCDALSYIQAGYKATVSVPNGANANLDYLDDYIDEYFDNKETIYIAVDTDKKGILLRDELIRRLGSERCKIVTYGEDCKDANEHLVKLGVHSLKETIKNAKEIKVDGIFDVSDFEYELDSLYEIGLQRGVTIGHKDFDEAISFETKRVMIVTGIPGFGKSEFVDEIIERINISHGWKAAYFSPENFPLQIHASKLISKLTGKKFQKHSLNPIEYQSAKEYVLNNFFFVSPTDDYTLDNVLEKSKYLVKKKGVRIVVIDPYNKLEHQITGGISETNYISKQLDRLHIFAQKNDCLVILVAHPRKMNKLNTGLFEIPSLYDINGSANFYNKADFGIIVHRDKLKELVEVHIQKVKFKHLGKTGIVKFHYNMNNGRFVPFDESKNYIAWDDESHLGGIKTVQIEIQYQEDDFFKKDNDNCPY